MESGRKRREATEAVDRLGDLTVRLDGVLSELAGLDLEAATDPELLDAVPVLVAASRRLGSVEARVLDRVDRTGAYRPDGHMSAKVMIRHLGRLSGAEANRRHKRVRMLRDLPAVSAAFSAGEVGSCQVDALARTHANPRVAEFMPAAEELLLEDARTHSFREFTGLLGSWERHVDADGAAQKAKAAHDGRDVRITKDFDGGWHLEGRFGSTQGSIIKHILGGFTRAETAVDWDKAKAEHGDRATQANLARTAAQRRADGFWELCRRAVTQPADGTTPEPLVNIVIDHQTALEQAAGTRPDPVTDPAGYRTRRCSTLAGDPIEPSDAFAAILTGQLRRVVFDTRSVVTDLGRKSRFFTGSARQAARLARAICAWTGCEIPSEHCEIDHATEWQANGESNQANGPPLCKYHNLFKHNHHFTITLQDDGTAADYRCGQARWHIYRPDGTELA